MWQIECVHVLYSPPYLFSTLATCSGSGFVCHQIFLQEKLVIGTMKVLAHLYSLASAMQVFGMTHGFRLRPVPAQFFCTNKLESWAGPGSKRPNTVAGLHAIFTRGHSQGVKTTGLQLDAVHVEGYDTRRPLEVLLQVS